MVEVKEGGEGACDREGVEGREADRVGEDAFGREGAVGGEE